MPKIDIISTAYPIGQTAASNQMSYTYNDTLLAGQPISFAFNLNYLNELRETAGGSTLSSTDINTGVYSLQSFLCNSIDGSNNFVGVQNSVLYSLSSSNLTGGVLSQNLYGATYTFRYGHDDLGATMSQADILKLYKEYNIVLRVTPSASPVTTQSVQNADIVHPVKLMLDTLESGPYDVEFNNIDLVSPDDFTSNEITAVYSNDPTLVGNCILRCCYPRNHSSLNSLPFILFIHGQDHNACMYDSYLNHLASYGYFVASVQRELTTITIGSTNAYLRASTILSHLKTYISQISSGQFADTIDFTKIILVGHSLGGTDVNKFTTNYARGLTQIPNIPGFSQGNDLLSVGLFEASMETGMSGGFQNLAAPIFLVSGSVNSYFGAESIGILQEYYNRPEKAIDGGVYIHLAAHENIAEPFSPINTASTSPQVYYGSSTSMLSTSYNNAANPKNTRTHQLLHCSSHILKLLSQYFSNNGSKNIFTNTNIQYKPSLLHDFEKTTIKYARLPITGGVTFIDELTNLSRLTSTVTGATLIGKPVTDARTASYNSVMEQRYSPNKFLSLNPQYRKNGLYVFPYSGSNATIGYTFGTDLVLGGNSFIGIPIGIMMESGATFISGSTYYINSLAEETHQHLTLELKDSGGITSWVSSKQNNIGIEVPQSYLPGYTNGLSPDFTSINFSRSINTLYFKCSDFKQLKPTLNLSGIREINLLIGPSYGISGDPNGRFAYNGIFTF
jgi:hypothetical protein